MAYIDETIVLRQIQTWLSAVASDVVIVGLGEVPPDNLDDIVSATVLGLTLDGRDRHSADDADMAVWECRIGVSVPEARSPEDPTQPSVFAISSAVAKVRNAIECKGASVSDHKISADSSRRELIAGGDSEAGMVREAVLTVRGTVIATSSASPEDRID